MADKKISELTALPSSGFATDDLIPIVDTSAVETKQTSIADLDARYAGSGVTQYTDEMAQDAVGGILTDTPTINFTYTDGTPSITADVIDGSITNAKVATGIDSVKIADGSVSNTEFQYLGNVTSDIQTQFSGKANSVHTHVSTDITDFTEAAQDVVGALLTDSSVIDFIYDDTGGTLTATVKPLSIADSMVASGIDATKIGTGAVSNAEFAFLDGVSSAIQTQIDGKSGTGHTHTASQITDFTEATQDVVGSFLTDSATIDFTYNDGGNTATAAVIAGSIGNTELATGISATHIGGGNVTSTEFDFLDGVTSAIQGQINGKQTATLTSAHVLVGNGSNVATDVAMSGDVTIDNTGATTIGAQKVGVSKMTMAANTLAANNTGSTAAPTAITFVDNAKATYSGSIVWTASVAPSGSTTHEFSWGQVGSTVFFTISLRYATNGTSATSVAFGLPAGMPSPVEISGLTSASERLSAMAGWIESTSTANPGAARAMLRRNSGDTAYEFVLTAGSSNGNFALINGIYRTA